MFLNENESGYCYDLIFKRVFLCYVLPYSTSLYCSRRAMHRRVGRVRIFLSLSVF
jgi:hypothetical protein